MTAKLPQIETDQLEILCWHDWYDGPLSGLVLWQGKIFWFSFSGRWGVDEEADTWDDDWGYIYEIFELTEAQLAEAVTWFQGKTDWFINRRLLNEGIKLRDWGGPKLLQPAIAVFTDRSGLKGGGCSDYGLPADFKIPRETDGT